jgi:Tol biopolymer transport system component
MSTRRFVSRLAVVLGVLMACWSAPALASFAHPYVSSFGLFTTVGSVAVDQSTGDVYVLDTGSEGGSLAKFDAAGNPAKFTGLPGEPSTITGLDGAGSVENEIAVDNSTGPAKGDIYVAVSSSNGEIIDIFGSDGTKLGTLSRETAPWGETCGVAVGPSGNVYVGIYGTVDEFVPKANPATNSDYVSSIGTATKSCNLAVDSVGNIFAAGYPAGPIIRYEATQFGSSGAVGPVVDASGSALVVDPADDHVYVDEGSQVSEFGAHGEPFEGPIGTFGQSGEGAISGSNGIAVDETSGDVYVSNGIGQLSVFGPGVLEPTVMTGVPTEITGHTATLSGSVNPEGLTVTECKFEYGTSTAYGKSAPCSASPGNGKAPIAETAVISGLGFSTEYYSRLVVSTTNGPDDGSTQTFTTNSLITTGEATNVGLAEATLSGTVDPGGVEVTDCKFEYGASTAYGKSAPCSANPVNGNAPVAVSATVTGLQFATTYHYRLAGISDETGNSFGADGTFTTATPKDSIGNTGLPDGRVYEMVAPVDNNDAEVYQPEVTDGDNVQTDTQLPFQASTEGNAIAYVGSPTTGGNEAAGNESGNQYVARRAGNGVWTQTNVSPVGLPSAVFQTFSSDLSVGFVDSLEALSPSTPGFGQEVPPGGSYDVLYSRSTTGSNVYTPVFSGTPPYRSRLEFQSFGVAYHLFGGGARAFAPRALFYAGASADSSHVLFEANDALTANAEGGPESQFAEENNLYESVDGHLRLVNVLPDGSTKANATFGGPNFEQAHPSSFERPSFSHVISEDGSRVFWTDLNTGHIYMRENGKTTVEISSAGKYWTATADGSEVFYTNGDLYEYDVENDQTTDLTPGVAVQGVVGASENGEYVYYVTAGFDLDLWHNGATTSIKTLAASDDEVVPYGPNSGGDWQPGFASRMAEVTPDGRNLVFMSTNGDSADIGRVEVYDADTNQVYCASCGAGSSKGFVPITFSNTYLKRWISADGSRVFFDSYEGLVPQDTNGKLDVYEWERPGSGSCEAATGCIYLLSGGTSTDKSYFVDASASGNDVFIVTRAKLLPQDADENYVMYDARVDGFEPVMPSACTGTGCQGLPGTPPIFATPSSVTFEGVGNFERPASAVKAKHAPKKKPKLKKKKRKAKDKKKAKKGKSSRRASVGRNRKGTSRGGARS